MVAELKVNPKRQLVGVVTDTGEQIIYTYEQLLQLASPANLAEWEVQREDPSINQKGTS